MNASQILTMLATAASAIVIAGAAAPADSAPVDCAAPARQAVVLVDDGQPLDVKDPLFEAKLAQRYEAWGRGQVVADARPGR